MDISMLIRQERETYVEQDTFLLTYSDINNGLCRMFARYFKRRASEHGLEVQLYESGFNCAEIPAHAWIEHNGNCYDADCPGGVSNPTQLPFYRQRDVKTIQRKQVDRR